jgi:mono/diheme cytochrome c family protein
VLGLDTAQMNRSFTYAATGRTANQLATFQHIGLFDAPLPGPTADLAKLPSPGDGSVPINLRARSYLHANCSHCHRPNGGGGGPLDFRYATADAAVGACDVAPGDGDLGVPGALLIYPGDPARSIVSLRMHVTDSNRMPPIARNIVDGAGTALIDAWIAATTTCP